MKINENGVIREMLAEEIAEMERMAAETPAPEKTFEERMNKIEDAVNKLMTLFGRGDS